MLIGKQGAKFVNGKSITTYITEIPNCNILEVEAGTNCPRGGDTGHGGRTYFRIQDLASTDIHANVIKNMGNGGIEVSLGGDAELYTIIAALKFIVNTLEEQSGIGDSGL